MVGEEELSLEDGLSQEKLFEFIRTSHPEVYSGIQKKYQPENPKIHIDRIIEEMKTNLTLLYPLYDMMSLRQKAPVVTQPQKPDLSGLFGGNVRIKGSEPKKIFFNDRYL
jgi:hypothetical protein